MEQFLLILSLLPLLLLPTSTIPPFYTISNLFAVSVCGVACCKCACDSLYFTIVLPLYNLIII